MHSSMRRPSGFTFIEAMIVVAILGLLAAVAIPQFTSNKEEGQAASMASNLAMLRSAIDRYWTQHDDFPGPTVPEFETQLLGKTDKAGNVGNGDESSYGPYLGGETIPTNPISDSADVKIVDAMPHAADDTSAWVYCKLTGEIRSNATGKTLDGVAYFDL